MNNQTKPKILVIAGPTASGKTSLAIELSKKFNGEVISADSRQVYKGLDIGSAKVTKEEMDGVTHHLLDVASPTETYTAADFKRDGLKAIEEILNKGKLPIVAGGTFFYIEALLNKNELPAVAPNKNLRAELEEKSSTELFSILEKLDRNRAKNIDKENTRRLIRAIEIATELGSVPEIIEQESDFDILKIALKIDKEIHTKIIKKRIIDRLDIGMIEEVESLLKQGVSHEKLEDFGLEYRYISRFLRGILTKEEMINELTVKSRQYAKRQITWLKRDQNIKWFDKNDKEIISTVEKFILNN